MKRIYVIPCTNVHNISMQQMVAQSLNINDPSTQVTDVEDLLVHEDKGWDIWSDD